MFMSVILFKFRHSGYVLVMAESNNATGKVQIYICVGFGMDNPKELFTLHVYKEAFDFCLTVHHQLGKVI